jgi:hypothetical protein
MEMGNQGNVAQPKKEEEKKSDPPVTSQEKDSTYWRSIPPEKTSLAKNQYHESHHLRNMSDASIISDSKLHQ